MTYFSAPQVPQHYLLIPASPTPNGPLHLGHMAGSYLRMDALARHRRSRGDQVKMIFGTDPYESYVEAVALRAGADAPDIATEYYHQIISDLRAFDISFDAFINPLDPEWSERYLAMAGDVMDELIGKGSVYASRERIPYSRADGRLLVGCWLAGRCPDCGSDARGFFCEDCGAHFSPGQIKEARPSSAEGAVAWSAHESLFLDGARNSEITEKLQSRGLPKAFCDITARHTMRHGPAIRLTHPGSWGVPYADQVIFSYSALYFYALLCGQLWGELSGQGINAFSRDAGVHTVRSFGIDACIPILHGLDGLFRAHGKYRPFDHLIGNYFYLLDGSKFSTSRRHAIFVQDVARLKVSMDAVRHYLALTCPEDRPMSMSVPDLERVVRTDLTTTLERAVTAAVERLPATPPEISDPVLVALEDIARRQDQHLALPSVQLALAAAVPVEWARHHHALVHSSTDAYWWLKGMALLAAPTMPALASGIWERLGHSGAPSVAGFLAHPPMTATAQPANILAPES